MLTNPNKISEYFKEQPVIASRIQSAMVLAYFPSLVNFMNPAICSRTTAFARRFYSARSASSYRTTILAAENFSEFPSRATNKSYFDKVLFFSYSGLGIEISRDYSWFVQWKVDEDRELFMIETFRGGKEDKTSVCELKGVLCGSFCSQYIWVCR